MGQAVGRLLRIRRQRGPTGLFFGTFLEETALLDQVPRMYGMVTGRQ